MFIIIFRLLLNIFIIIVTFNRIVLRSLTFLTTRILIFTFIWFSIFRLNLKIIFIISVNIALFLDRPYSFPSSFILELLFWEFLLIEHIFYSVQLRLLRERNWQEWIKSLSECFNLSEKIHMRSYLVRRDSHCRWLLRHFHGRFTHFLTLLLFVLTIFSLWVFKRLRL